MAGLLDEAKTDATRRPINSSRSSRRRSAAGRGWMRLRSVIRARCCSKAFAKASRLAMLLKSLWACTRSASHSSNAAFEASYV